MRTLGAAVLLIAALLAPIAARADDPPMTPQQMETYLGVLFGDRASQQLQIDRLRLQVEDLRREEDEMRRAAAAHDAAVDRYWREYTGLRKR